MGIGVLRISVFTVYYVRMRFEVPQFIEIEDKIFGPFTWRQFVYLCGGVGFGAVILFTTNIFFFIILGLPVAAFSFLLAFYPVNNRPFSVFVESMVNFYRSKRIYYWRKHRENVYQEEADQVVSAPPVANVAVPTKGKGNIHSLSRQLELNALQKQE